MLTDSSNNIHARTERTEDHLRKLEEHFDRLRLLVKSFDERLAITEPWLPEEHFVHSEPEYYLAAFLYSFLPNGIAANQARIVKTFPILCELVL
jgi:hypothetical protein